MARLLPALGGFAAGPLGPRLAARGDTPLAAAHLGPLLPMTNFARHQHDQDLLTVAASEVRSLVRLTNAAVDLFFFGQQSFEVGIGLAEQRLRRRVLLAVGDGGRLVARGRGFALGLAAA